MEILVIILIGVVTGVAHIALQGWQADFVEWMRVLLLHQFVVTHGLVAIIGFIINVIIPKRTAAKIGWPSSLYQVKYGFHQLGLGVMGVLSIWFTGNFWAATLVTLYMYGVSGLWTHTIEIVRKRRATGRLDANELFNVVLDVIYHAVLTWMSLQIPGIWTFSN